MVRDVNYIIKRVLIGVLIGYILSIICPIVKADSVCLNNQTQWLQSDYSLNSDSLDLDYFYSRPFNNCSEYVKVQIPVRFTKANINIDVTNVQYDTNYLSGQYRLDLSNGDSYYGRLVDGYLEFYVRGKIGDVVLYPKHLSLRLPVIGDTYMIVSRFIQAYSIDSDNTNVVSSINNVNNSINDVNNSINNDSVDTSSANNTFNDLNNNMSTNSVISDLLLMPINFINKVLDGANDTCTTYHVGDLWGDSFDLPCINGAYYVGATLWNVIDCIGAGMLAFMIGKRMVKIFNDLTNLKDGGLDSAYD